MWSMWSCISSRKIISETDSNGVETESVKSAWKTRENPWKVREKPVKTRYYVFRKISRKPYTNIFEYFFCGCSFLDLGVIAVLSTAIALWGLSQML